MFRKALSVLVLAASLGGVQAFAGGGGNTGDVIVIPNFQQEDSFSVAGGGGNTGDFVILRAQQEGEFSLNASGTSKGGDVPVVTG